MYENGMVVEFVQNMPGVLKGSRFTVMRKDRRVWLRDAKGRFRAADPVHGPVSSISTGTMALAKNDLYPAYGRGENSGRRRDRQRMCREGDRVYPEGISV